MAGTRLRQGFAGLFSVSPPKRRRASPAMTKTRDKNRLLFASGACSRGLRRQKLVEFGGLQGFSLAVGDDDLPSLA